MKQASINFEKIKNEASQFMSFEGNSKGLSVVPDLEYVKFKEGEGIIQEISLIAEKVGYPYDYNSIAKYEWYPEKYTALMYLILKEAYGWTDEDLYDMGFAAPTVSFITKVILKFTSLEASYSQSPKLFKEHYDFGEISVPVIDEKGKRIVLEVRGYPFKITTPYFRGYFAKGVQILVQPQSIHSTCESCGEGCDRYTLTWT